ncbi:uncharacterized protein LOC117290618 [Asterias rubens]|uniref:uncharacterized protein LOC117290618 n=1 Tax=Asterias rubens TaxID=7604 RepID=UPI001454FC02|nr:uncharacterized protein LOC117290618 [Asterias rubens]XP_033627974.1 uncharacterized protein LOC117290618 [Asterias rubens]
MAKSMLFIVSMLIVLAFITPGCESQELEDAYSECESTEFQCANRQCIPDEGLCDGEPQCEDYTDEYKCQEMEELALMYETIFDGDIIGLDLNDTGSGNDTFEEATQTPGSKDQVAKSRAKRSTYFYIRGRRGRYYKYFKYPKYPRGYLWYIVGKWCRKHKAIKPVTTTTTTTLAPTDKPIPSTTTQEPTEAIPSTSTSATSTNDPTNAIPSTTTTLAPTDKPIPSTTTQEPTNAIPSVTSTQDPTAPPP